MWQLNENWLPYEVVGFFEMRSNSDDFMDEIFDGNDVKFTQNLFDYQVTGQGDSLAFNLAVASLVNQSGDKGSCRLTKQRKNY